MVAYVGHIEKQTRENTDFRRVLFTGKHAQLVVMCLEPGEQIGDEVHQNVDQFFRIEQGAARFVFNEGSEHSPWWARRGGEHPHSKCWATSGGCTANAKCLDIGP